MARPFARSRPIFIFGRAPNGSLGFAFRITTSRGIGRRAVTTTTPIRGEKSVMPDGAVATGAAARRRRKLSFRPWLRAFHRDIGYFAVGLTVVYATSGIAVNHLKDWDPNFKQVNLTHQLALPLPSDDDAAAKSALVSLGVREQPREVYRA